MTDALKGPVFKPLDPARFSATGPIVAMTIERAVRIGRAMAADGASPRQVRRFLNAYGFDQRPVFDVTEGGAHG
jgi:hypothetical protein